jgi:16S rRNA (uracil1498-N3)-methyltransferase
MNIVLFDGEPFFPRGDARFQHIRKVLRMGVGDSFFAGMPNGPEGTATITSMGDSGVAFTFAAERPMRPLSPARIIIGFPRPIQLRRLLRDVASLGAEFVYLTGTELGEKSYLESSLADEGAVRECMVDGCVQAGGTAIPGLSMHASARETLRAIEGVSFSARVLLDVESPVSSLARFDLGSPSGERPLLLAIGSERGWSASERALFRDAGFAACSLGQRILRTETAATAALAIALANSGLMEGTK